MKFFFVVVCALLTGNLHAGPEVQVIDTLVIHGIRYESVKIGSVKQDQVVLFHSRGVVMVPLADLPQEIQARLAPPPVEPSPALAPVPALAASKPVTTTVQAAPPAHDPAAILEAMKAQRQTPTTASRSQATGDWAVYNRDRFTKVVLDGRLVDRSTLQPLVGFLVSENAKLHRNGRPVTGAALDIAVRREEAEKVAGSMELRPSLWRRTDERVFLIDYTPNSLAGALMKVYVVEIDPVEDWRTFKVGREPSFEEWKRLPR